jgi:hypothetical protein
MHSFYVLYTLCFTSCCFWYIKPPKYYSSHGLYCYRFTIAVTVTATVTIAITVTFTVSVSVSVTAEVLQFLFLWDESSRVGSMYGTSMFLQV